MRTVSRPVSKVYFGALFGLNSIVTLALGSILRLAYSDEYMPFTISLSEQAQGQQLAILLFVAAGVYLGLGLVFSLLWSDHRRWAGVGILLAAGLHFGGLIHLQVQRSWWDLTCMGAMFLPLLVDALIIMSIGRILQAGPLPLD